MEDQEVRFELKISSINRGNSVLDCWRRNQHDLQNTIDK
jgi:hypothetical protein